MDSQIFEIASPTKIFFRCAIPAMISMAVGSLYQIADGVFVGRFIGGDALAAVNLIMPLITIVFAILLFAFQCFLVKEREKGLLAYLPLS